MANEQPAAASLQTNNVLQSGNTVSSENPLHSKNPGHSNNPVQQQVQRYYGEHLTGTTDLKTNACCPLEAPPRYLQPLIERIAPEVLSRFYGCGSPLPPALTGCTVLDLGCGTGRDVFIASQLVGPGGFVHGVDMTPGQLAVAHDFTGWHMERFGYESPNVAFHESTIEDLRRLPLPDASIDVVISNCVINLSSDKSAVFDEIFRLLKPGGELFFSDVFADRRIPAHLMQDELALGECLAGAMYAEDFRRLLAAKRIFDPRTLSSAAITVEDPELRSRLGNVQFQSRTIRTFKLASLEDCCEDYGQVAVYRGGLAESPAVFVLDDHHRFELDRPMLVCGNTASMLAETRYAPFFEVRGGRETHFGLFDCAEGATALASSCC